MTVLTDTQVVTASGGLVELGYVERTTSVAVSGIFSSQTDLGLSVTVVCDGSPILIEFFCEEASANATAGDYIIAALWQDGSEFNRCTAVHYSPSTAASNSSMYGQLRVTPSAGSHTYSMKGFVGNAARPGTFFASASGIQSYAPMRLRVSKIVTATQWPAVTTGTIICTSSTRPASPFAGQQIYETDTSKSLIYSGSVWQPPWNTAWGSVAAPATWAANSITSTSTADTTLASVTFVAVAGRRYRTSWIFDTYCSVGYGVSAKVKNGATWIATVAYSSISANLNGNLDGSYVISGLSAGSCTINLTGTSTVATMTYYGSVLAGQFAIEDIGPA